MLNLGYIALKACIFLLKFDTKPDTFINAINQHLSTLHSVCNILRGQETDRYAYYSFYFLLFIRTSVFHELSHKSAINIILGSTVSS